MSLTMDKLVKDLNVLKQRKEEFFMNFQRLLGAISVLEQLIAELVRGTEPPPESSNESEKQDEQTDISTKEQVA